MFNCRKTSKKECQILQSRLLNEKPTRALITGGCYKLFGSKKYNDKGCEDSCKSFHPNGCRDSLKNRTCSRTECRFFHLSNTKLVEFKKQSENNDDKWIRNPKYKGEIKPQYIQKAAKQNLNFVNKNRFEILSESSDDDEDDLVIEKSQKRSKQVFQKEDPSMSIALKGIMKKLADIDSWQKEHSLILQKGSSQKNWRKSQERESSQTSLTQEQIRRWASQDREDSQKERY